MELLTGKNRKVKDWISILVRHSLVRKIQNTSLLRRNKKQAFSNPDDLFGYSFEPSSPIALFFCAKKM